MRQIPLRVVVVHWNQPEQCRLTVGRFLDREVPVRVTVVDNDSTPANLERLYAGLGALDAADQVEVGHNSGFGPGANVGLRRFLADPDDGEWVVLCPHDVDPAPGCLS
ncbi:MAG: glycosyltransferase family 2 protein, partial [Actinomycetes bacterium]